MEMWRRHGEAASAAALYSVYSGLYSEAVVSSMASAVALAEVGRFREAVDYVQKAAKALYEAARDVFEHVKVSLQRLTELFVKAVTRVLAWVDKHRSYLFLMATGVVALSVALNLWGMIELDKLAYAASLTPFVAASVKEHPREEVFNILRSAPNPYEEFKKIAREANAGRVRLAEPWESLRVLILPKPSEESRLMVGKAYRELDERMKKALFYAVLTLEEAFGVYKSALREVVEGLGKAVQRVEVGEEPFRRVVYMADLGLLTQLAEEEGKAFEDALKILRKRLNEYAVRHVLRDLLDVDEDMARRLAEAEAPELSEFSGVNFGVKAYAALIAYREYTLGRRGAFGRAAWHWLEEGGSAWLFYYAPNTARIEAERAKVERPAEVGEMVVETFRRLFLMPDADRYSRFVEELVKGGKLALMFEKETESSYVFKLYNMREGGGLVDLGVELWIEKVGKGIIYTLKFDDVERWLEFFKPELETAMKAVEEVGGRLPVEDRLPYMLSWATSDVAITRKKTMRALAMSTSHLWQFAETHALFGWSVVGLSMSLTLEGPKLVVVVGAPLENLDDAIRESAEGGWLKMLGTKAGLEDLIHVKSWDGLKQWVADHWGEVLGAVNELLKEDVEIGSGFDLAGALKKLEGLKSELGDDKTARKVIAPALLLIQAERLGVNEETLSYFAAVISDAVGGDGFVSAAMRVVILTSGEREIALLWAATLAAYGIKTKAVNVGSGYQVVASGDDAIKLADLYFLYGPPLLEGDEKVINHKLVEVVRLGARGLGISWERLRPTKSGGAADLIISVSGAAVKYNVYLRGDAIVLKFQSTNRGRVELAARLLRLAGVTAEVKREGVEGMWYIEVTTDKLAAGREELRKVLAEIVKRAVENDLVDAGKAEGWLVKLEEGLVLAEELSKYGMWLSGGGALMIRFGSTSRDSIEQEAAWLEKMGLREGRRFSVKMPEGGKNGYVSILREGLAHAAWLSVRGSGEQQKLAADFVKYILERAKKKGGAFYEKAKEIIDEGMSRGSLTLEGFEKRVEVNGEEHTVKVEGWSAELEKGKSGKPLLRIKITAKVDDVLREYAITYGRYDGNTAKAFAYASADAPGGREADAKRFAAVIKALTGREPGVYLRSDGTIEIECGREHLDGFWRYKELADAIEKWLEQTEG